MNSAIERLISLRVGDVMNPDVVTIPATSDLSHALDILHQNEVSGAPVVNEQGCCVGVLSLADVALKAVRAAEEASVAAFNAPDPPSDVPVAQGEAFLDTGIVQDVMSPVVQTVAQTASIMAAARLLCQEHIHRLIIVDQQQRPVGVLSSLDLVAAMVAAIEE